MPTSTGTVATKPRKNGIFDNVDVTKRSLLFKCLRVARSHRENTAIPSTEGLSEGHCHNPLQNNGLENGYSRIMQLRNAAGQLWAAHPGHRHVGDKQVDRHGA